MPEKHLIIKIRELIKELKVLDTKIKEHENKIKRGDQNKKDVEKLKKEIEDLKRRENEFQKERSYLQKVVQLQGTLETKERRIKELKDQIKELEQNNEQIEELNKEIVDLKRKKDEFENEIIKLKNDIRESKIKIEGYENRELLLENEIKENELNHENRLKGINAEYCKKLNDFKSKTIANIKQQRENHSREMEEIRIHNNWLEDEVKTHKMERSQMKNDLNELKKNMSRYCAEENQHILYLGQLCSDLQRNWYRHVIPKHFRVEQHAYKVKHIIRDICEIPSEEEQRDANRRWRELKSRIDWKQNERLIEAIKRLQQQRNLAAHPKDLSEEGARSAAEELRKQGKLGAKPSFEDVLKLIRLWVSSESL